MKIPITAATGTVLALFVCSCSTRLNPSEISDLPQPSGVYMGSIIVSPWIYRGTNQSGHHLVYSWYRDSIYRDRKLVVAAGDVRIVGQFPLTNNRNYWKAVRPIISESGSLEAFKIVPKFWAR